VKLRLKPSSRFTSLPSCAAPLKPSALACAAVGLFAASVGYWVYRYFVAFGRPPVSAGSVGQSVAWNVILFGAFALHHSLLARPALKTIVERRWPGQERQLYVATASVLLVGLCAGWQPLPGIAWRLTGGAALAVQAARLAALGWIVAAARTLDLTALVGLRPSTTGEAGERPTPFRMNGPYGVVRHPIYTGWLVTVLALPAMSNTQLAFAGCSALYILVGLELEEYSLRSSPLGAAYQEYARKVPAKLLPFLY
jgi:protein-S-isoprenylcysteine O-methyltransferase Ste14